MQGKSSDFARHALPSIRKQRILVTFTKCQPKKYISNDNRRISSPAVIQPSHWAPPPGRSLNHVRHPAGSKHFASAPTTNSVPTPPLHPQVPSPNGIQPVLVSAPVAPPISFPAPVPIPAPQPGWPVAPPRHPPPHPNVPGTGVFLPPPGSASPPSPKQSSASSNESTTDVEKASEKERGSAKSNQSAIVSPKGKLDVRIPKQECNGTGDGSKTVPKEENHEGADGTTVSKLTGAS